MARKTGASWMERRLAPDAQEESGTPSHNHKKLKSANNKNELGDFPGHPMVKTLHFHTHTCTKKPECAWRRIFPQSLQTRTQSNQQLDFRLMIS